MVAVTSEATEACESYEKDFAVWIETNIGLLRAARYMEVDTDNLAEEIEALSRNHLNELTSRLVVLVHHLLKWQYQPERRGSSWQSSIDVQRDELKVLLARSPSLRRLIEAQLDDVFRSARRRAIAEAGSPFECIPKGILYTKEQILSQDWFPSDLR